MLVNETMAKAATARPPEHWIPVGARPGKQEGVKSLKDGVAMKNNRGGGSPLPVKFFTCDTSIKYAFVVLA